MLNICLSLVELAVVALVMVLEQVAEELEDDLKQPKLFNLELILAQSELVELVGRLEVAMSARKVLVAQIQSF